LTNFALSARCVHGGLRQRPDQAVEADGIFVESQTLRQCEETISYTFKNPALLTLALTHASVACRRLDSNERLEFLGDAVLGLVVCDELYSTNEEIQEGEMTRIKSTVVSRVTCALIAEESGLAKSLFLGKGMADEGMPQSVAAAVFEAIIGAIYIDGGIEPAREFILRHVRPHIAEALDIEHQQNYKSLLQQYAQREMGFMPQYYLLDEKGPDHSKCFEMAAVIGGRHFPTAWGKNKKDAEQKAALRALVELGEVEQEAQERQCETP
jgi:ribonuclease-3